METNIIDIRKRSPEAGMATAEYAIGTVSATGIAGILWWLINQDWFRDGFVAIFKKIFNLPVF